AGPACAAVAADVGATVIDPAVAATGAGVATDFVARSSVAGPTASLASLVAGAACDVTSGAAPVPSIVQTRSPCETLSPIFDLSARTMPPAGDGTSIVALSDSSTMSGASFSTRSPSLTSTSITGTPL